MKENRLFNFLLAFSTTPNNHPHLLRKNETNTQVSHTNLSSKYHLRLSNIIHQTPYIWLHLLHTLIILLLCLFFSNLYQHTVMLCILTQHHQNTTLT